MSGIPEQIPSYGEAALKPRQNPEFTPGQGFGTEDYYVWSRCDGSASIHDIILMVGLGTARSIEILVKLRELGAVLLPGETAISASGSPDPVVEPVNQKEKQKPAERGRNKPSPTERLAAIQMTEEELAAVVLDVPLTREVRVRIIEYKQRIHTSTLFQLLEVEPDADKRTIKRSYFRLSKEFHPDRYYKKDLGPFRPWLDQVFRAVTAAFGILGDNKKRAEYEAELRGGEREEKPETKEEHAMSLFQQACDTELQGDIDKALQLFAASIRLGSQPRYMRRAAMCAVQARKLDVAEDYARQAIALCEGDASYLRVLADVHRASGQLEKAKEVLGQAIALDTENDILFGELQSDLAAVETAIAELLLQNGGVVGAIS